MKKKLPGGRIRVVLSVLGLCLLVGVVLSVSEQVSSREFMPAEQARALQCNMAASTTAAPAWPRIEPVSTAGIPGDNGTLEKMIVAEGAASMSIDLGLLNGAESRSRRNTLRFRVEPDSFFKILVFNDEFRGPLPSSMALVPQNSAALPSKLAESYRHLIVESLSWGGQFDLVVRDARTGFVFFNIEGYEYDYDPIRRSLAIQNGRVLLSSDFAAELGRPAAGGTVLGQITVTTDMRSIEVTQVADGEVESNVLPGRAPGATPESGSVPGPDVVVGELSGLAQFGITGTQVGLAVGTDSCNFGTVPLNWFANPANDHPTIPQNLYRMSGGPTNDERFEQIGQSQVKHAFTALQNNICNLGCSSTPSTTLGSGCSDPYSASLNATPSLGSKAWINPFTGFYPRNDSATPNNVHSGHTHPSGAALHRILTEISDLSTTQNPGATYYTEAQYVTPHEYAHCQANPGQCNMYNNASYRRYNVSGTGSPFSFSPVGATVRSKAAIVAWTGASSVEIKPAPGVDGVGTIAYKVTNPSPGVWHYEYAILNQNIDRGIQSFSVPTGAGVTLSNTGFRQPPQHPGFSGDGTLANAGFSSTPWAQSQAGGAMTWSSQTFAENQNANAIRWATMYNFRFDSNRPPQTTNATIGFFKTGAPIMVQVQGPTPVAASNVSVSGRVTAGGYGVRGARVSIADPGGNTRYVVTGAFGYYQFNNVLSGATYTVAVGSKRYTFTPQTLPINDNLTNVDFSAAP